jgi:hypothetical protein
VQRAKAIGIGEEFLRAFTAGQDQWPLSLISEVYVFGSVARGALTVGDLDLDVEHEVDERFSLHALECMTRGADPHTALRVALRGRRRSIQLLFNQHAFNPDFGMVLLWRRGESAERAIGRLRAIAVDPGAGRAPRDAMLPEFEGLERWIPRTQRHQLHEAARTGALRIERITVPDGEAGDEHMRWRIERSWSETSPLRRAGLAIASRWEQAEVPLYSTRLHTIGWRVQGFTTTHYAGFGCRYLGHAEQTLRAPGVKEWLEVVHPTANGPLAVLRITRPHTTASRGRGATR